MRLKEFIEDKVSPKLPAAGKAVVEGAAAAGGPFGAPVVAILAFKDALAEMEQDKRIEIIEDLVKATREELDQVSQKVEALPVSTLEKVRDFYRRSEEEREALLREFRQQMAVLRREHEELPTRVTEKMMAALTPYLNGLAQQGLEVKIITPEEEIIALERRLKAGEVDEAIWEAKKFKAEKVRGYRGCSGVLARGYLLKGDDKFHIGHFEEAEEFYRLSLNEARSSEEEKIIAFCFYELGAAVGMQGRHEEAGEYFTKAIELGLDDAEAYNNRGLAYGHKEEHDGAISDFDKAIELRPDYAEAYNNRGVSYRHKGEHDGAISDFNKAIELRPDLAEAYNNRGVSYRHKGEHDRAISDFDKAIELRPDYAEAYNNRGVAYGYKGEHGRAISDFDKAIQLRPDLAEAYNNRGLAYGHKEEHDGAISDFDKAIELRPDLAEAYNNRGLSYRHKGEHDRAISDFDKAIELKPDFAEAMANKGSALLKQGELEKALHWLGEALKRRKHLPDEGKRMFEALAELGEAVKALPEVNAKLAQQVKEFIEQYRPVLEALAER